MKTFSPDEIEKARLQGIEMHGSEDEQGNVDPGIKEADHQPGSFSYHEALHAASIMMDSVDRHLVEHPAVLFDPEAFRLAFDAHTALFNLYQHLGKRHL